jgi:hypothetical protein
MARLKKGVLLNRLAAPEHPSRKSEINEVGYRHCLVDWLNRAFSGTAADREAAERVGALIKDFNDINHSVRWVPSMGDWIPKKRGRNTNGVWKTLKERAPWYKFQFDIHPSPYGAKWELVILGVEAPSGQGDSLHAKWEDEQFVFTDWNPELMAAEAVIHLALDGQLGTIRQCEIPRCSQWFLTKNDSRVRRCQECGVQDRRKDTPRRQKQLARAQSEFRRQEKLADEHRRAWGERQGRPLAKTDSRRK